MGIYTTLTAATNPAFSWVKYPIYLIAPDECVSDDGFGSPVMRRDELMKPDLFSEMLLLVIGLAMFIFLASTLWMAMFHH